jgi:hypothetical protein
VGPRAYLYPMEKRNIYLFCHNRNLIPRSSTRSSVAMSTELTRLLLNSGNIN